MIHCVDDESTLLQTGENSRSKKKKKLIRKDPGRIYLLNPKRQVNVGNYVSMFK